MPGPVPNRSDQRRRTNPIVGLEQAPGATIVRVPPAVKAWHPIARDWYRSLARSGQARYYEPSDWQTARLIADQMTRLLTAEDPNAALLNAIVAASRDLMTTEGQRRRMRLELLRDAPQGDPAAKAAAADVDNILAFPGALA